ncbi:hypothetical protein M8J76_003584 [Diaphorina citri]|nr:hypothetical protein M8J76_003584 [Diaphorina citri]
MRRIKQIRKSIQKIEIEKSTFDLIQDYTQHSSVHGVRYMSNQKAPFLERIFWLLVLVVCILFACILNYRLWQRYTAIPTVLAVKDTHVPLYLFPFPSVTICPANKVKKSAALEYFSRYINISSDPAIQPALVHIMSALSLMQKPSYHRMAPHINASMQVLPLLSQVNISDFMLHVLPKCEEVFGLCSWHGKNISCCEIFSLQKTEEGYCYSFNSLTSEEGKHCPLSEVLENEGIVEEDDIMHEGCQLRRNTAVGTVTGLEVFLREYDSRESEGIEQRDLNGAKIMVHTSYDCVFPDEKNLSIYHVYTQTSCFVECRLQHIVKKCHCHMYYFTPAKDNVRQCGIQDFECILLHTRHLRLLRPPDGTPGFDSLNIKHSLNCSRCAPTCYNTEYDLEISYVPDARNKTWLYSGHLDIFYGNLGARRYLRDITFTSSDLLVFIGGVANLFLGFSLLSVVEFIYWFLKIAIILGYRAYKKKGGDYDSNTVRY